MRHHKNPSSMQIYKTRTNSYFQEPQKIPNYGVMIPKSQRQTAYDYLKDKTWTTIASIKVQVYVNVSTSGSQTTKPIPFRSSYYTELKIRAAKITKKYTFYRMFYLEPHTTRRGGSVQKTTLYLQGKDPITAPKLATIVKDTNQETKYSNGGSVLWHGDPRPAGTRYYFIFGRSENMKFSSDGILSFVQRTGRKASLYPKCSTNPPLGKATLGSWTCPDDHKPDPDPEPTPPKPIPPDDDTKKCEWYDIACHLGIEGDPLSWIKTNWQTVAIILAGLIILPLILGVFRR